MRLETPFSPPALSPGDGGEGVELLPLPLAGEGWGEGGAHQHYQAIDCSTPQGSGTLSSL
jgi:hypothetical protein